MRLARFLFGPIVWARLFLFFTLTLVAVQAAAIDLNQATALQLQQIKGIGPKTAERIIEERDRAGPYRSLQDLSDRIKGIGAKRVVSLEQAGLKVVSSAVLAKGGDKKVNSSQK